MKGLGSVGSKLAGVFKAVGTTLLNGLASAALSWGITKLGEGLKWVYDNWLTNNAEIEAQKKALEDVTAATEKYLNTVSDIDDVTKNYEELSEKIKDQTLTASELAKVKSELKDVQDQLINQFGDEAYGIDLVNGKYDEQIEKIRELKKEEAKKYLYGDKGVLNGDNLDKILKYTEGTVDDRYQGFFSTNQGEYYKNVNDVAGFDVKSIMDKYSAFDVRRTSKDHGNYSSATFELVFDKNVTKKEAQEQLTAFYAELNSLYPNDENVKKFINRLSNIEIGYDEEKAKQSTEKINEIIKAWLLYNDKDSISKSAEDAVTAYNEALEEYLKNPTDENDALLSEAFSGLLNARSTITDLIYDSSVPEELRKYFRDFLFSIFDSKELSPTDKINNYFKNATGTIKAAYGDMVRDLSEQEKGVLLNLLENVDINALTIEDLAKIIKEAQDYASQHPIELETKVKASAAVDSMADMKSAVASLSDLYNQTVLQAASENVDSFGTFAADPATLNSIESAFDKFIQEKSDSGSDVTELNAALKEFERISVESYGSEDYADQMQSAINNLITAYIDQTDAIKNLDEANKKWSVDQLEAMGITNAEAVVEAKLSKKTKELMANVTKLAKAYDKLDKAQVGTEEYSKGLEEIASAVKNMLDLGDVADEFNISTGFVSKNLDLIKEAAAGSSEAINQLRKEASKEIATQIHIEGNPQEVVGYQSYINNLIDNFDIEDIEVGTRLDDNPMIQGLNNLVEAGKITRDSMNAILAGIGVVPDVQGYEEIPITMENLHSAVAATGARGTAAAQMEQAMRNSTNAVVRLPKFGYKLASKGTGAKYSAPSGGGSSGGGGGGGGSEPTQPKEESEEMFDWVEVAIQRIEEEISRLDKVVGNTYETWGERNEARIKEIKELEKEYKALGIASSEYFRNAEKVQVNGGKGLNDDDYGENDELVKENDQRLLDEAKAAWATGEYKKKVQQGLLTGDDIEKIANHFLSDTIKEYQEIYQKGVDAQDKEYDKLIELGNQYKGAFDDVKEEYSELIQYITDQADVIDERINRTEKRGYFVSKSYYEDLKALEAQRYSKLDAEYEDLIKKRDEAVASGTIKEGSEAWHQMNQEINGVNLELEKSKTQMVEYNNTIRQLDWD